ncbi:Crotonobetainyl-CoA:carnitine CoA-transferase CaiB [Tistlia consotensis]|uniref:Crotonobetainyl-CoA:carnitine CoA-transferase CaiB n=1 Tax=Tistlia consotensis USBA 355 TaxID=560819 RepID=A0A1Y6C9N0_9PROT|nr:CoA transferase [Tistlia consotensis]SMF41417.1 Crotonobetainyl-CoA:carnitine CoA-transferase CaiB [Tistlia consotensis USBA 355]SNR73777.1 Crotonobetainyl-CoA:carnitine CoA-transferase CaiB [Tistlia consotensis]
MTMDRSASPDAGEVARPFQGVRIVDVSHVLAGPYCSYQLALLGADVIRIEPPANGDIARNMGPDAELNAQGLGLAFLGQNSNKRSLAIDLKSEAGKAILWQLIDTADVFIENYRPGVMRRLGFDCEAVLERRPDIVYASLTGYGQEGPLSTRPAYDHVLQGLSGMMSANHTPAGERHRVGFPVVDYVAGLIGAFAIASALFQRTHSRRGQVIDVAMLDAALAIMGPLITEVAMNGRLNRPGGTRAFSGSPLSGIFETDDGLIVTTANTHAQAVAMLGALGLAEQAGDPRLRNWGAHPGLGDEFAPILRRIFAGGSAAHWEEILSAAGVPASRVRDLPEILDHPHLAWRQVLLDAPRIAGLDRGLRVPGVGFKLANGGQALDRPPPRRGQHSVEVLESLGCSVEEIDRLIAAGVVGVSRTGETP